MNVIKKSDLKILYIVLIFSLLGIFTSCSPEYIPNMVNTPLFSNQGEFEATVATGTSNFDAQLGYAITDHIAVIANGSYANQTNDTTDEYHKHLMLEGGVGYYHAISSSARFEIFGGYGIGEIQTLEEIFDTDDIVDVKYNRIFVQPAIGAVTDFFDGSFSPRVSFVQMNPGNDKSTISESWNVFIEPVITTKFGYKYVKAVIQFGYSFPINEDQLGYNTQRLILNIGLTFNIGRKPLEL